MRVVYNKLVRDKIPQIIRSAGHYPCTRVLGESDYRAALLVKLTEESREAQAAPDDELVSELADVLEVLHAIAAAHSFTWAEVVSAAADKRGERGGFHDRIFLEYVEEKP